MTIFDVLGGILFTKKPPAFENIDEEKSFDSYMTNRWLSMVDSNCAKLINETTNKFGLQLGDKTRQYNFLKNITPRYKYHKINYIKKKSID